MKKNPRTYILKGGTMQTKLNPYISFKDNTREAMEFYKSVFDGKLTVNTFKDFHASPDPSEDNKVMHSVLEAINAMPLSASSTECITLSSSLGS